MYQYDDPTVSATLPPPAVAGTPGYFTDGNPGGGVAATDLTADFMNMLMMELLNVVEAGGLTPSKTTYTQVRDAVRSMVSTVPQCQLTLSGSNLLLKPVKAGLVYSPGFGVVTVPGAGITLAPAGLTANTLYYIYLNPNAGSPVLVASTTTHVMDPTGVEVQSGNNSLVLVGMAWALSATSWESTARSWANDPGYAASAQNASAASTTSTTPTNVTTALQLAFLLWAGEIPTCDSMVIASTSSANYAYSVQGLFDSVAGGPLIGNTPTNAAQATAATLSMGRTGLSEGRHTYNTGGSISTGSVTLTFASGCTSAVQIAPRK